MTASRTKAKSNAFGIHSVFVALVFACIALTSPLIFAADVKVSEPAPDFALKSSTGKNLRLSDYRGSVVVLNFWSESCGKCRQQLDLLEEINSEQASGNLAVLGVNIDRHGAEHGDHGIAFPTLFDIEHRVSKLYDLGRLPTTIVIDPHGTVRQILKGFRKDDADQFTSELQLILAE